MLPLLLAAAAAPAIIEGVGSLVSSFSKDAREARKMRREDLRRLKNNRLGYTHGQKRSMASDLRQQINAELAPAADELKQQVDASGSFGRSGYNRAGLQAIQAARAQATARGWNDIEKRSQDQTLREEARIRGAAPLPSPWAGAAEAAAKGVGAAAGQGLEFAAAQSMTPEQIARMSTYEAAKRGQ